MVVAVAAVGMVQVAAHEVVHVVAVRHGLVAAAGPVDVALIVAAAGVGRRAGVGIRGADGEAVLVHMPAVDVVKVAVVQKVHMAVVADGGVAAAGAVLVGVVGVGDAIAHDVLGAVS